VYSINATVIGSKGLKEGDDTQAPAEVVAEGEGKEEKDGHEEGDKEHAEEDKVEG
jgi:hypothetical protein